MNLVAADVRRLILELIGIKNRSRIKRENRRLLALTPTPTPNPLY
jgi:hypothetical protein